MPTTPDLFLSHNSRDKPAVEAIAHWLTSRGIRPWLDKWELQPGKRWQPELAGAIGRARGVAVFVGADGLGPWETPEMEAFLDRAMRERGLPVIPVLLPGAPEDLELQTFLRLFTWVDLRAGVTEEGLERLAWGITGQKPAGASVPASAAPSSTSAASGAKSSSPTSAAGARKRRLVWGTLFSGLGLLLTLAAWFWPFSPNPPGPTFPPLYAVRVQVLDPDGQPVPATAVRASAGNEPQGVAGGWWEVEIPEAKVPADRRVSLWAESADWAPGRADLVLGQDPNPRAEIRLTPPQSVLGGQVVDATGRAVPGARVLVQEGPAASATSNADGHFELRLPLKADTRLRLRAEHPAHRPEETFCYTGRASCAVQLEKR